MTSSDEIRRLWREGQGGEAIAAILSRLDEMETRLSGLVHPCACGAEISTAFELCDGCAADAEGVAVLVDAGLCPVCMEPLGADRGCSVCDREEGSVLDDVCPRCGGEWGEGGVCVQCGEVECPF